MSMRPEKSRRSFLAAAGASLAVGTPFCSPAQASPKPRVLILGAGVSGLSAARQLVEKDFRVQVIEARDRIGGRLHTSRALGKPVEMGAQWIHGTQGNPISALARLAVARTVATDDDKIEVWQTGGRRVADSAVEAAEARYHKALKHIENTLEAAADVSLAAALARQDRATLTEPLLAWALANETEFDAGAPADALSAYWFDEDKAFSGPEVILPEGYDAILQPLAKGLDIRLNTVVRRVSHGDAGIWVETNAGVFEADYAVCSLPLGVLKADDVVFEPPLPATHRNAMAKLGVGSLVRAVIAFAEPQWPAHLHYLGHVSSERGRWPLSLNLKPFSGANILSLTACGPYAEKAASLAIDEIRADILLVLKDILGREPPPPTSFQVSIWSRDPFARGAYSVIAPGARPADFAALAEPIGGRLLLTGEHTDFDGHGTVHGACIAGRRTATQVERLAAIRP